MRIDDRGVTAPSDHVAPSPEPTDGVPASTLDPAAIAEAAAEAVALINHHRAELRATVEELTALQRDVRAQVRELADLLDRAAAVPPPPVDDEPRARRGRRRS